MKKTRFLDNTDNKKRITRAVNITNSSMLSRMRQELGNRIYKGCFFERTPTTGSDVVQSRRPIFNDFFQHLWPYIGNNTANAVFQIVKRLWLIRIDK
ncbi:hypothetical protein TNCV_1269831 [Trichonephila clavipes]|nr:hypothetical protein TNCV_1269831 [Trichonephila clavipes]